MKTLILKSKGELKKALVSKKKINFIPTMGNLHNGHLELIKRAKKNGNTNLVSIYVNPLQFNDKKDLKNYPRSLNKDLKFLKELEVDLVYLPEKGFSSSDISIIKLGKIKEKLCGKYRKGHFEGVATIILKFLLIIKPDKIFLGEKDFQQVLVIKNLIKDFRLDVNVATVPIVRNLAGVALSSRNQFIHNIKDLLKIYSCLIDIKDSVYKNNFFLKDLEYFKDKLTNSNIEAVNYLEILKESDLSEVSSTPSKCRIFISCNLEGINLIDNVSLNKIYKSKSGELKVFKN